MSEQSWAERGATPAEIMDDLKVVSEAVSDVQGMPVESDVILPPVEHRHRLLRIMPAPGARNRHERRKAARRKA